MKSQRKHPKLGFRNASVVQQIDTCAQFVSSVQLLSQEQRAQLPEVDVLEAFVAQAIGVQEELAQVRTQVRAALARQKKIMPALRRKAARAALAVTCVLDGDERVLRGIGLKVEGSRHVKRPAPHSSTELRALSVEGSVKLRWRAVMRRCWYDVEYAMGKPENWTRPAAMPSAVRALVTLPNFQPGILYWFRVRAHNANGRSDWSQPLSVRCL